MIGPTSLDVFRILMTTVDITAAIAVTLHALKHKKDVRAGAGWIALAWLSPFLGSVLYFLFGINRIARRAIRLERNVAQPLRTTPNYKHVLSHAIDPPYLMPLAVLAERVSGKPLLSGNHFELLVNGDAAYPAMIKAIDGARRSIALCSYIFRTDSTGLPFIDALSRAHRRGVAVRVLLDGMGAGYFISPTLRRLSEVEIPVARFLHTWVPWRMPFVNMRMHKKLLVVDGVMGYTGGINISAGNLLALCRKDKAVQDLHFQVTGPIVHDLLATFAEDWNFTTGEVLRTETWSASDEPTGSILARGLSSGPNEDLRKLETIIAGAINAAQCRVRIVAPYFLPDQPLLGALTLAALRGVKVEIVLPRRSNHRIMDWAAWAQHGLLVDHGCEIHLSGAPFDHSKIMTVDGAWSLVGSANWDVRSLRLNFEYDLEAWNTAFAAQLDALIDRKISCGQRLTTAMISVQSTAVRLRNAAARLLLPYL